SWKLAATATACPARREAGRASPAPAVPPTRGGTARCGPAPRGTPGRAPPPSRHFRSKSTVCLPLLTSTTRGVVSLEPYLGDSPFAFTTAFSRPTGTFLAE